MQKFVEEWIEKNKNQLTGPFTGPLASHVVSIPPEPLREFLSGFTLIRGPFKVEDKKPENGQEVLAFNGEKWEKCLFENGVFLLGIYLECDFDYVTHWMPMPDPVK